MSPERLQDEIHDYLDGRLSESERAAFERRLEHEPDLARRVAAYRGIGRAIREDEPTLSPGFYARARARFEDASARPRRAWRLLSWEAAGLSAAVVLAAAIFLPGLLRRDETLAPSREQAPAVDAQPADDDRGAGQKPAAARKEVAEDLRVADELAAAPAEAPSAESRLKQEGFAPVHAEEKGAAALRKNKLDVPAKAVGKVLADAPQPELEPVTVEAEGRRREVAERSQSAGRGVAAELEESAPVHETVTLGSAVLERGTVRIVDEQAWRRLAQRKDQASHKRMASSSAEADFAETRRVVLIGARPGLLDCSRVSVEASPDAYIVRVPPEQGETGPDCAIILPLDEREILVSEAAGDG